MIVKVVYCSNYNGANVEVDGKYGEGVKADAVMDAVIDFGSEKCSDDGEYYGNIDDVEEVAIKAVKEAYGDDVQVEFEEDSTST